MEKKRLFVDMDGTLARFHDEVSYLERMFEKHFFRDLKPFENMVEGIRTFMQDHPDIEVFIISAKAYDEPPYCLVEKNEWLDKHLPEIDRSHRIFTEMGRSKAEFVPGGITDNDYILDDYNHGLNLFMHDGGKAIKCHNNINHRALGAHGGKAGRLWTGPMVHVEDKPQLIAAELAQHMGIPYDLQKVADAYNQSALLQHYAPFDNPLDAIRVFDGKTEYVPAQIENKKGETLVLPHFRMCDFAFNAFGQTDYRLLLEIEENDTVFKAFQKELQYADKAVVGEVYHLDPAGKVSSTLRFYSKEEMQEEIERSLHLAHPIDAQWFIPQANTPLQQMDFFSMADAFIYTYKLRQDEAFDLASIMQLPPETRSDSEMDLIISFWETHHIDTPIHSFLSMDHASYSDWFYSRSSEHSSKTNPLSSLIQKAAQQTQISPCGKKDNTSKDFGGRN